MRHHKEENFKVLEKWAERHRERNVIICGDFNARTACEGGLWDSNGVREERYSKDGTVNEEGKELIGWLEENGMGIGNGATEGDGGGEWTYIGARGCTTIDYGVRNELGRDKITKMEIGGNIMSDHLLIEMELEGRIEERRTRVEKKSRKIVKWGCGGEESFREILKREGAKRSWRELKEKVVAALPLKSMVIKDDKYEKKWWDKECHEKKEELKRELKKLKDGTINGEEWREKRREYRNLIERKKNKRLETWVDEMENDK